jgi:hypothetical protein
MPDQARQHVLQDLRMHVALLRAHVLDGRQLGALAGEGAADAALLPGVATLLQASVIEFAAAAHDKLHGLLLLRRRFEFVLVGLANRLLVHRSLLCLIGVQTARRQRHSSPDSSRGMNGPISVRKVSGSRLAEGIAALHTECQRCRDSFEKLRVFPIHRIGHDGKLLSIVE